MSKQGPTLDMEYRYGFSDPEQYVYRSRKGLDRQVVEEISAIKGEPDWMRKFRLKALQTFESKPMPGWGGDLSRLRFEDIYYYIRPTDRQGRSWDEVPDTIKKTFDRLGIPEAERKFLAGVTAQYECLTGDTLVMGNPGPVPIREIEPGTFVYALNEETRRLEKKRVLGVAAKGERPVFRVQVGGRNLKCTANHPFLQLTYTKEPGKKRGRFVTRWAYLSELKPGDYVAVVRKFPDAGEPFKLPPVSVESSYQGRNQFTAFPATTDRLLTRRLQGFRIPEYTNESFMWFAGLYLGDGYHRRHKAGSDGCIPEVALPDSEPAMREILQAIGFRGDAHTTRLPKWVFHLPLSQRLALLGGYIDSDGGVRNGPKNSHVVLTSVNEELLKQVQLLAMSCGLQAAGPYAFESRNTYKGVTTSRTAYRLVLSGDLSQLAPYSEKVAKGYRPRVYRHHFKTAHGSPIASHVSEEIGFARIRSIEPAGTEMVYDIEVEGAHNFVAQGVVVHNSEVVYHSIRKELERQGVIFVDTDTAVREHPDLVREHFGTVVPPADNKFAALNSAVWSGGSFIWVPEGVKVEIPLQAYFRINARNMGQFERTLIIAEPGSFVHYVEGCTAPQYTTDSLHSAVVEIIVKPGARVRYTTIQNWSHNVYNLVTKRAAVYADATMEWVDGNIGCLTADTQVFLNPRGPVSIKDVRPGDYVYAVDLQELRVAKRRVNGVAFTGVRPVFRLTTENHRGVKATANHPFLTLTRARGSKLWQLAWQPLERLQPGDLVAMARALPDEGAPYRIDFRPDLRGVKQRPRIPAETDEDLMWLLGFYVGDGFIERAPRNGRPRHVNFAVAEKDPARPQLERILREHLGLSWTVKGGMLRVGSAIFGELLLHLGFGGTAHQKRVPRWVYGVPARQRLAFLEGYLAADGHVRQHCTNEASQPYGQVAFASCNRQLLEDIRMLMMATGLNPLQDLAKLRGRVGVAPGLEFVRVRSIEPLGEEPVYDIEVEGAHNFVANGLVVHNSKLTMKYPSVYLLEKGARGEVLSVAFAGPGQHQDAGAKAVHYAPYTTSVITNKSICKDGGRTTYRGLVHVADEAFKSKSKVNCDALIFDDRSRTDTIPYIEVLNSDVQMEHEATVSKVSEEQLFYLMSRGIPQEQATSMIVMGFIEPFTRQLPMEYAVELNRLIELEMEGSVG